MTIRVALAAGGTGGHLFPAEALASALAARGARPMLVTDPRTAGFAAVPGLAVHRLPLAPMRGGIVGRLQGGIGLCAGTLAAHRLMRRERPDVVVGFGGYPSVPTVLAARRHGCPVVLHEQNAVLGKANRLLAPRAAAIATSFGRVRLLPPELAARVVETGNPVRPAIAAVRARAYEPPVAGGPVEILVMGGSQGARVFATIVPAAIGRLADDLRTRIRVVQQARADDVAAVEAAYGALGVPATVARFFDDVPDRLARAALVISRSGASTVAELAVAGRPAILVPYPHAADDHQTDNAQHLADAGGAWVAPESGLTAETLAAVIATRAAAPPRLAAAAWAAAAAGRPDAAERLADMVMAQAPARPLENAA
ncbi:MAG: undecaprenyldiphospho-muramoylpentapeptide beta-N-acetylglucosaminyltransferase [Alphaproteobacteria bacterium]